MIKALKIKNFRSVEDQTIPLTPINFLYGNNAAGKSSLFYSLNVLRNVVSNPNQSVDAFFNLGFANLGTFKQVVFRHEDNRTISIAVDTVINNIDIEYGVNLNQKQGGFFVNVGAPYNLELKLPVTFPYPINGNSQQNITIGEITYLVSWNGISAQVTPGTVNDESAKQVKTITSILTKIVETIRSVDIVSQRRGFYEPQYGVVNINQFPIKEEEVASMLAVDDYLDSKVSTYLEQTIDRQFRAKPKAGSTLSTLTTIEKVSKNTSDIVNDGFGVNQIAYLLAKTLNKNTSTLCIEEPEINLHPSIVRRLPKTLIELTRDENKQLLISTHSETLVLALLSAVAKGEIGKKEITFYLAERPNGITNFNNQEISENGQIAGGLNSFMLGELENVQAFLKSTKKKKSKASVTHSETSNKEESQITTETKDSSVNG